MFQTHCYHNSGIELKNEVQISQCVSKRLLLADKDNSENSSFKIKIKTDLISLLNLNLRINLHMKLWFSEMEWMPEDIGIIVDEAQQLGIPGTVELCFLPGKVMEHFKGFPFRAIFGMEQIQ